MVHSVCTLYTVQVVLQELCLYTLGNITCTISRVYHVYYITCIISRVHDIGMEG